MIEENVNFRLNAASCDSTISVLSVFIKLLTCCKSLAADQGFGFSVEVYVPINLIIAGLNMLNKIIGTIFKVFTRPDYRSPIKTSVESIDNTLDKKEFENYASVTVNFKKLRKIPIIHHFINISM